MFTQAPQFDCIGDFRRSRASQLFTLPSDYVGNLGPHRSSLAIFKYTHKPPTHRYIRRPAALARIHL
jgi:hypothetical protein